MGKRYIILYVTGEKMGMQLVRRFIPDCHFSLPKT